MRAVDTNLLVRLLVRDDVAQVTVAEAFVENGAWVTWEDSSYGRGKRKLAGL